MFASESRALVSGRMDCTALAIITAEAPPVVAAPIIDAATNTVESELSLSFTKDLGAALITTMRRLGGVLCWRVRTRKDR